MGVHLNILLGTKYRPQPATTIFFTPVPHQTVILQPYVTSLHEMLNSCFRFIRDSHCFFVIRPIASVSWLWTLNTLYSELNDSALIPLRALAGRDQPVHALQCQLQSDFGITVHAVDLPSPTIHCTRRTPWVRGLPAGGQ